MLGELSELEIEAVTEQWLDSKEAYALTERLLRGDLTLFDYHTSMKHAMQGMLENYLEQREEERRESLRCVGENKYA